MRKTLTIAIIGVFTFALTGSFILGTGEQQSACGATAADAATAAQPAPVDGYSGDQLVNAAAIMNAGAALGLDTSGQTIGMMTAMANLASASSTTATTRSTPTALSPTPSDCSNSNTPG